MNPSQPESPLTSDEIRLIGQVGYLAGACGDLESARKICNALEHCRPNATYPHVVLAMAQLNRRERDEAVRTLERGVALAEQAEEADEDDVAALHALRALALRLAGRSAECDRAIRTAGNHPLALALAANP